MPAAKPQLAVVQQQDVEALLLDLAAKRTGFGRETIAAQWQAFLS